MGSKTQTQTSAQTTTPINQAALQGIYNQVQGAAQTPYTPYTGELTAPVNAQQTSGINNVNANANYASPYIQQAAGLTQGAAQPLTAAQIQQYQNPYTQNVVNATQAQFNESNGQQQQQVKGNAALAGALGGDRQAVAQAETARQQKLAQDPVIAGLYQNSYNSGLQTAGQQFQQNPLAAASQIGNLGVAGQNAALQGAGQQINAGTLQQQTQQAADTANYGQYQAKQAFPYQQAQFLEQYGLPSALAQGTTSNGTQTSPGPNTFSQIAGLGIAGAGLFLKDGGAVNGYAPGGDVGYINSKNGYIFGAPGYIPTANGPAQNTLHAPTLQYAKPSTANPFDSSVKGLNSLSGAFSGEAYGGGNALTDAYGGSSSSPLEGLSAADYGEGFKIGGLVHAIHSIHRSIKRSRGGAVGSTPFRGFDDGGDVSFDDRFSPAVDSPFGDLSRGSAIQLLNNSRDGIQAPASIPGGEPAPSDVINPDNPYRMPDEAAVQAWRDGVDHPNAAIAADVPPSGDTTAPDANPMRVKLPPQISNPDSTPEEDSSPALAYDSSSRQGPMGANGLPTVVAPVGQDANQQHFGHSLFGTNISDKTRQALVAAGLGIMASRSPFALSAIGEGGLQGLKSFSESNKLEQDAADKAQSRGMEQQRIDLQAKQIAASIENQRRTAASAGLIPDGKGGLMVNPSYLALKKAESEITTKDNFTPVGSVVSADGTTHPLVMNRSDGHIIDAVTQKPPANSDKIQTGKNDPAVVEHLAHGIESGQQPPSLTGLYGKSGDVRSKLDEHGFDLAKAQVEWKRAEKQIATLNGPQMTRFVGLAHSVNSTIDEVRDLSKKMANSGIPVLNRAKLAAYMQLEGNSENGQLAARYIGAVNTLKEEFANLANGGYAPTEPAWELANKQINGDYGVKQLGASLDEVQRLIRYRVQAIPGLETLGAGASNRYTGEKGTPLMGGNAAAAPQTKTIGSKTYIKRGDQWFEQ